MTESSLDRNSETFDRSRPALAAFLVSRLVLLLLFMPQFSDLQVYFEYAVQGVDLKRTPYKDFQIEYPPVSYWLMTVPRLASTKPISEEIALDKSQRDEFRLDRSQLGRYYGNYARGFRWLMFVFDLSALLVLRGIVRRRQPKRLASVTWGYVIATAVLGHLLYDRLDLGLLLLLLVWSYARVQSLSEESAGFWNPLSYFVLGVSVSYKLLGVVAFPFLILSDWQSIRRNDSSVSKILVLAAGGMAGVVLPFVLHYPSAGFSTLNFLKFHGERGIQIESTYASLMMLLAPFGQEIGIHVTHGSADLVGNLSKPMAGIAMVTLLAALSACGIWALRQRENFDQLAGYRMGLFAILMTLFLSKVLSAQYFIFAIPLMFLLSIEILSRRAVIVVVAIGVLIAVFTTTVMPYYWFSEHPLTGVENRYGLVSALHPFPCGMLILRNLLFGAVLGWLGCKLYCSMPSHSSE